MPYSADTFTAFEQPTTAKWNKLWSNDASFNDGTGLPQGTCVGISKTESFDVATGTTTVPVDNTIPQNTEGDQYMTVSHTPKNAANLLVIEVIFFGAVSIAGDLVVALFKDSTANALTVGTGWHSNASERRQVVLRHTEVAGTTSPITYKVRAGANAAATTTINGSGGARLFGTITKSSIIVREYTQ